jgi:SAM-dependent methyltransferase
MLEYVRRRAAESELLSFNVVRRDRWIAAQARQLRPGTRILDVGAGSAPYRGLFSHCHYKTQDLVPLKSEQLRGGGYGAIDFVCDAASIPVADASFDAVLCTEMLEHHCHPERVVREIARILTPGGKLLLTAPLGSGIHQEPFHYYGGYTPFWYEKFLTEAGFEQLRIEPNEGFLRLFGQESIRFVRATRPFAMRMPLWGELLWVVPWLILAPVLGMGIPVAAKLMQRFERDVRFTVGYHVTAVRRGKGADA